jgi:hypothetical protein
MGLSVAALLTLTACGGEEEEKNCTTNSECPAEQLCILGDCRASEEATPDTTPPEETGESEPDVQDTTEDSGEECLLDEDCPEGKVCLQSSCTEQKQCESDSDCDSGYECIGGDCFEKKCRGPSDCSGDKVCNAGECEQPPEAKSCFVATSGGVITFKEEVQLQAFARDADGNGIPADFEWTSSDSSVVKIDSSGPVAIGEDKEGTATVTATLTSSGSECEGSAEFENPGDIESGNFRVTVTEVGSGNPIEGATVKVSGGAEADTNGAGVASLPLRNQGPMTVSVFADEYNYFTVTGVTSKDIKIPLSVKDGAGEAAGFKGSFDLSNIHSSGNFTLGLAGASFPGGLINLDIQSLLGKSFQTSVGFGGTTREIPLPGGIIGYGNVFGRSVDLKRTYYAETAEGGRLAWGLAGKVPSSRMFSAFQNGGGLAGILPIFNRFDHAAQPVDLQAKPLVTDSDDFDNDGNTTEKRPDYGAFKQLQLSPSVQQDLVTEVSITNFPSFSSGQKADTVILVGGAVQGNSGFLPLGISGTSDENSDGQPDARNLFLAPPHGSVTGSRYAIAALAVSSENGAGFAGSNTAELSTSIWTGQRLSKKTSLGTFPDASEGTVDRAARTVDVTEAHAGPLMRFQVVGQSRSWRIWSRGSSKGSGTYSGSIEIPNAPSGMSDPLGSADKILVDAISASANTDDLVSAGSVSVTDVGLITSSFSRTNLLSSSPSPSSP